MRSVVVGARGAVGTLISGLLADAGSVTGFDLRAVPDRGIHAADVTDPNPGLRKALMAADIVVLALPGEAMVPAIHTIAGGLRVGALVVDTSSVKHDVCVALDAMPAGLEALGINPMFAPDLGFAGRPVAVIEVRPGPTGTGFRDLLRRAGAEERPMTAQRHDELTAGLQVATHASILAFGLALRHTGLDVDSLLELAPPPHRTMLVMLARMASASPDPYREIQADHQGAQKVRQALRAGLDRLDTAQSQEAFGAVMADLSQWLGPRQSALADKCAEVFRSLR